MSDNNAIGEIEALLKAELERTQAGTKRSMMIAVTLIVIVGGYLSWVNSQVNELIKDKELVKKKVRAVKPTPRRDDLTGVGVAVAPTKRPYPTDRATCTHKDQQGMTTLRAQGGQTLDKKTMKMMYAGAR